MPRTAKAVYRASALPDIGLISIPVLCCLLGAAFFVYVFGGQNAPWNRPLLELQAAMTETATATSVLEEREEAALGRALLLKRAQEIRRLEEEMAQLARLREDLTLQVADVAELARLQLELERLREQLAQLELAERRLREQRIPVFRNHTDSYILVECLRDEIVVHPTGRHIGMFEFTEQQAWLCDQIDANGYVAFAVRPGGWTDNSFDRVSTAVYDHLASRVEAGHPPVRRVEFPLAESDSIIPYLPLED